MYRNNRVRHKVHRYIVIVFIILIVISITIVFLENEEYLEIEKGLYLSREYYSYS